LIKANDALTFRFLVRRSARHEDAPSLFGELVRSGSVPPEMARWRRVLTRAIREKSAYDYGSREIGRGEAERWIREAARFLRAVREGLAAAR
jgi:HEPN domain-containing protein